MAKENTFRKLLLRASQGKANVSEYKKLEKLVINIERKGTGISENEIKDSRRKVLDRVLSEVEEKPVRSIFLWTKYAASIALIIGLTWWLSSQKVVETSTSPIAMVEIHTEGGERRTMILPDGSEVVMNANSSISYPENFEGTKREITLKGEAFFKVKRNTEKPFVVYSSDVITTVLGTSFNIYENEEETSVTVVSGKVKVQAKEGNDQVAYLVKDDQLVYLKSTGLISMNQTNSRLYADWSKGILHFDNLSFDEAIQKLENWYKVDIECSSKDLLNRSLKGTYDNKPLEYILEDLKFILDLKIRYENDSTIQIIQNETSIKQ